MTIEQEDPPKTLRQYLTPTIAYTSRSCITLPTVTADFEINLDILRILPSFHGRVNENPYSHLNNFLELCTTFKLQNLNEDGVNLRLFPFSLKDRAERWLMSLAPGSIITWAKLQTEFLKKYFTPIAYTSLSCITLPTVTAEHFEINPNTIQMLPSFYGCANENPYSHLNNFLEICTTFKLQNLNEDDVNLRLFPISLKDRAKEWLMSLAPGSITTWAKLQTEFLKKYFPIGKTIQMRKSITNFAQFNNEPFYDAWERFNDLIRQCPHHAIPKWQLVYSFYEGLTEYNRQMVDACCGGTFMMKSEEAAWELFETLSDNSLQHIDRCRNEVGALGNL